MPWRLATAGGQAGATACAVAAARVGEISCVFEGAGWVVYCVLVYTGTARRRPRASSFHIPILPIPYRLPCSVNIKNELAVALATRSSTHTFPTRPDADPGMPSLGGMTSGSATIYSTGSRILACTPSPPPPCPARLVRRSSYPGSWRVAVLLLAPICSFDSALVDVVRAPRSPSRPRSRSVWVTRVAIRRKHTSHSGLTSHTRGDPLWCPIIRHRHRQELRGVLCPHMTHTRDYNRGTRTWPVQHRIEIGPSGRA